METVPNNITPLPIQPEIKKDKKYLIIAGGLITLIILFLIVIIALLINRNNKINNTTVNQNMTSSPVSTATGSQSGTSPISYTPEEEKTDFNGQTGVSFQKYKDWNVYSYPESNYNPAYSSKPITEINEVIVSKEQNKRLEIIGTLSNERIPVVLAVIKMLEVEPFEVTRTAIDNDSGLSKFEDKWMSLSFDIVIPTHIEKTSPNGYRYRNQSSVFIRNNNDGTWTAAFNSSDLNNELVNSLPDEYFQTPYAKENFLSY